MKFFGPDSSIQLFNGNIYETITLYLSLNWIKVCKKTEK